MFPPEPDPDEWRPTLPAKWFTQATETYRDTGIALELLGGTMPWTYVAQTTRRQRQFLYCYAAVRAKKHELQLDAAESERKTKQQSGGNLIG